MNLLLYHGVLGPRARGRSQVVRYGRPAPAGAARVFDLDVLACPRRGGRLRGLATVQDPVVARTILAHLGLALSPEPLGPAPPAPAALP